ncbi:hypothetical protein C8J57DRAFT_1537542 [Mycena rebaudengoi]|nr:hypothetical protein C8J57DRAFT_1537542 [Mycena rebaudengoi]
MDYLPFPALLINLAYSLTLKTDRRAHYVRELVVPLVAAVTFIPFLTSTSFAPAIPVPHARALSLYQDRVSPAVPGAASSSSLSICRSV